MSITEQINKAIKDHVSWRDRIIAAIRSRRSEVSPEDATRCDRCDFGKWLESGIPPELRNSDQFEIVKSLHQQFHGEIGKILNLALKGKDEELMRQLSIGDYFGTSSLLQTELMKWGKQLDSKKP